MFYHKLEGLVGDACSWADTLCVASEMYVNCCLIIITLMWAGTKLQCSSQSDAFIRLLTELYLQFSRPWGMPAA